MTDLAELGLRPGEPVRWRRSPGGRWLVGKVERIEADDSIGVRDSKGASRALAPGRLEVRATGPRGATMWEPLTERSARTEQMELW
ncbi:MAG: hypothetical protein ABIV94_02465 [Acidimicrobiales bacterium]